VVRLAKILTKSPEETIRLGESIAHLLQAGDTVALVGVLGSGKSVLARGIMAGLGVATKMPSPSFVIVASYQGRHAVNHIDLYRLDRPDEAVGVGIEDMLYSDAINVIEWAEKIGPMLPAARVDISMELRDEPEERLITVVPGEPAIGERLVPLIRDWGGAPR
jgi:tRNA threonylcarbamoyladenosine biosynthesis protein TsaE